MPCRRRARRSAVPTSPAPSGKGPPGGIRASATARSTRSSASDSIGPHLTAAIDTAKRRRIVIRAMIEHPSFKQTMNEVVAYGICCERGTCALVCPHNFIDYADGNPKQVAKATSAFVHYGYI